jgi:hypothetical protein
VGHGYERGHVKDGVVHDLHGYDVVEEVEVAHHTIVFDEHMDDNDENILMEKEWLVRLIDVFGLEVSLNDYGLEYLRHHRVE